MFNHVFSFIYLYLVVVFVYRGFVRAFGNTKTAFILTVILLISGVMFSQLVL